PLVILSPLPPYPFLPPLTSRPHPPPLSPLFPYTTLFRSRLRLPTSGFTEECQRNHSEVHVLVHPNQTNRGNFDPGLFPHFSHHADRKSTRLNSSHVSISYAVFCLKNIKVHYYL